MNLLIGRNTPDYAKDTVYRFMKMVRINWIRFTTILALSTKVKLLRSALLTGIRRDFTLFGVSERKKPAKSRVPAILSTVSNQRICPTQLDCEINRIRLKLHKLYATTPLTSQAVHFRVSPKTRILVKGIEKSLLVTMTRSVL